jgi:hypothetical protein
MNSKYALLSLMVWIFVGVGLDAQNVGIGTNTPLEKLHVAGNLRVNGLAGVGTRMVGSDANGTLVNIAAGANGQVLTQTGGGPAWQSASNDWSITGNVLTNPVFNFAGTADNVDFVLRTNSNERIRILAGGNVGIGTGSPSKKLDVLGDELVGIVTPRYTGLSSFIVPGTGYIANFVQAFTWPGNEHLYVLFNVSGTIDWAKAQELARSVKGHLPTITSSAENNFVKNTILVLPAAQGHIPLGHTDALTEGRFECITGEIGVVSNNTVFAYWGVGQPDNTFGAEDIVHYFASSTDPLRGWNDLNTNDVFYNAVIVEFEYTSCP